MTQWMTLSPPFDFETVEDLATLEHSYASTQVNLPDSIAAKILSFPISTPDLAEKGRELIPHVTVKYGLHTQDSEDLVDLLERINPGPVRLTFGKTGIFQHADMDVLQVQVVSEDLVRLNKMLSAALDVTDTYPGYWPHATIAYLKKGEGTKYTGQDFLKGEEVTISDLTYTTSNDISTSIPLRALGGLGSGFYGHAGRRGKIGGSASSSELSKQEQLVAAQTNPLAFPSVLIGLSHRINGGERYVAAYGQEFKAQPLPKNVLPGTPKECYRNASMLVMGREDLTYAEGFATTGESGMAVLHAWAVDAAGNVIDPTVPKPQNWKYFGVKYDRTKYLKYLYKAEIYGVLGSTVENAQRAVNTGGAALR